jgi:hypothetical protein
MQPVMRPAPAGTCCSGIGYIVSTMSSPQIEHGYRLEVVTVRKLEFENDAFGFADKVIEKCASFCAPTLTSAAPETLLSVELHLALHALRHGHEHLEIAQPSHAHGMPRLLPTFESRPAVAG